MLSREQQLAATRTAHAEPEAGEPLLIRLEASNNQTVRVAALAAHLVLRRSSEALYDVFDRGSAKVLNYLKDPS